MLSPGWLKKQKTKNTNEPTNLGQQAVCLGMSPGSVGSLPYEALPQTLPLQAV